jgi:hypothetical protein
MGHSRSFSQYFLFFSTYFRSFDVIGLNRVLPTTIGWGVSLMCFKGRGINDVMGRWVQFWMGWVQWLCCCKYIQIASEYLVSMLNSQKCSLVYSMGQ